MEKLFVRSLIGLLVMSSAFAQDSLCVFDLKGSAYLKIRTAIEPLGKGSFLNDSAVLMLNETAVTAIDSKGQAYKLNGSGEYKYRQLLKNKVLEEGSSLTAKYFKLIWDEFLNKEDDKTIIGGVFRGEIPMQFPPDSAAVLNRSITFEWDKLWESENSYVFLRNISSEEVLKLATNGNKMTLFKDNPIFRDGDAFQWTVSGDAFPNLDNIPFFNFNRVDRNSFEARKSDYSELISDLKSLGLTDDEIDRSLCETYGLCR